MSVCVLSQLTFLSSLKWLWKMQFCRQRFFFNTFRHCVFGEVCPDSWEGCHVPDFAWWRLLLQTPSLHHDNSVFPWTPHLLARLNLIIIITLTPASRGVLWSIRVKVYQMWTAGWWWGSCGMCYTSLSLLWWTLTLMVNTHTSLSFHVYTHTHTHSHTV